MFTNPRSCGKRKMESGSILLVSHNIDPPFPFSMKSESRHYPSDGLISLCAVMQRETEYQIRFNINLSWKRCICMKQKTAFHDYSFSDKKFIAAHIRSWVSHEAFLNLMSDFACEIYSQFLCSLKFNWRKKLHKIRSCSIQNGVLMLVYKSITKLKPGFRFFKSWNDLYNCFP